ncbi:MAG TPA: phosphoribosylformylglycinamidine cyclo-ligase [Fimbriimonadaceae bacterium]|mgnify:CR=1 FL=1|nr:phosphoribosylformylglycinamidine cyclo-ligase [Fimbriimonadaceae bacterium]
MADEVLTYASSGVDIDAAERALRGVLPSIKATYNDQVVSGVGGFGGLFRASFPGMERPVLVSSIDGVGTKTKVAAMVGKFDGLGADIVNHCINDILCQGARPLFFMDYYGTSRLTADVFEAVVGSAALACKESGVVLLGGETAEMPGVYHDEEVDIVGSIVGVVDMDKKLPKPSVGVGDALVGIASDGLHTNGFSLARRALFEVGGMSVRDLVPGLERTVGEELLRPHRCYFNPLWPIIEEGGVVKAIAHITGGGLYDNLPRVLSNDVAAQIERRSWTPLPIFDLIQKAGNVPDVEMFRTFNMGIGLVVVCDRDHAPALVQLLNQAGEAAAVIGELQRGSCEVNIV